MKRTMKNTILVIIMLAVMMITQAAAPVKPYQMINLPLPVGGYEGIALDINDAGQIVGWANLESGGAGHPFLWQKARATGWYATELIAAMGSANGINSKGHVVGSFQTVDGERGFLWKNGTLWELAAAVTTDSSTRWSWATDINRNDVIVGVSSFSATSQRAVMWIDGVLYDLGTLGGESSAANAINDKSQIVGWSQTSDGYVHATMWWGNQIYDLSALDPNSSWAQDINSSGQVVGYSVGSDGVQAFVWDNFVMHNLGKLGYGEAVGWVINDRGQLVINGDNLPFLWDNGVPTTLPVPEGITAAQPWGINGKAQIVGRLYTSAGNVPVLWTR